MTRAKSRTIEDVLMTYEPRPSAEVDQALDTYEANLLKKLRGEK